MNKLLTYQGAQPVYLGDIDFMQDAAVAGFKMLAKTLMDDGSDNLNAILQGVEISKLSSSQTHVSSGIVVINGELLPVSEATISVNWNSPLYLHVESVLSSERTFKNGQTHKCHDTRSAVVNGISTGGIAISGLPRYSALKDAVEYIGTGQTYAVEDGRLVLKQGFWFIEAFINRTGQPAYLGSVTFEDLTTEHMNSIDAITFPVQVVLEETATGNVVQSYSCAITKDDEHNRVTFTFYYDSSQTETGIGYVRALIPVF